MTTSIVDAIGRIPLSANLTATLSRAAEYAGAQAHVEIGLEHLLLALTEDPDAGLVLSLSHVEVEALKGDISSQIGRNEERLAPGAQPELRLSNDLRQILEAAAAAAEGRRREIDGAIVLAAIVGEGKSASAHLLRIHGLTFETAIRALQQAAAVAQTPRQPEPSTATAPPPAAAEVATEVAAAPPPAPHLETPRAVPQSPAPHQPGMHHSGSSADDILASARQRVQGRIAPGLPELQSSTGATRPPAAGADSQPESARPAPSRSDALAAAEAETDAEFNRIAAEAARAKAPRHEPHTTGHSPAATAEQASAASPPEFEADSAPLAPIPQLTPAPRPAPPAQRPLPPGALRPNAGPQVAPQPPPPPAPQRQTSPAPGDTSVAADPPQTPKTPMPPRGTERQQPQQPEPPAPAPRRETTQGSPTQPPRVPTPGGPGTQGNNSGPQIPIGPPAIPGQGSAGMGSSGMGGTLPQPTRPPVFDQYHPAPPLPRPPQHAQPQPGQPYQGPPPHGQQHPPASPGRPQGGPPPHAAAAGGPPRAEQQHRPVGPPPLSQQPPAPRGPDPHRGGDPFGPARTEPTNAVRPPSPPANAEPHHHQQHPPRASTPSASRASTTAVSVGQLVENIPRSMRVAVASIVEVRIARAEVKAVAQGMQGSNATFRHELTVTKAMSVRLRAPDGGFFIETSSPETQWIDNVHGLMSDDYASWRWTVTPKLAGRKRLQLVIAARTVGTDGLTAETQLPEQVVEVVVRTNYGQTFKRVAGWAVAAVLGGVLARFGEDLPQAVASLAQLLNR